MGRPVVHFEINGKDVAKLQKFYGDLFDWKIDANNPMNYGLVDTQSQGGINGGIGQSDDGPSVRFYIEVDDLQAYVDKAEKLGGKVLMPPEDLGMVQIAMFSDPEGNQIGLVKSQEEHDHGAEGHQH